jgi:hypothetical protein
MKLHPNVVELFLNAVKNLSGHADSSKLRNRIAGCQLSIYTRKDGTPILVETERLISELRNEMATQGTPNAIPDVSSFYLHTTVVNYILKLEQIYGGYANEAKLKKLFTDLDLTPYHQKTTDNVILIRTEDYMAAIQGKPLNG